MIVTDTDGITYLNYIQAYGDSHDGRLELITETEKWLIPEINLQIRNSEGKFGDEAKKSKKILDKLTWLKTFLEQNKASLTS